MTGINKEFLEFIKNIKGNYGDDYGYSQEWNNEHIKWIKTVLNICPGYIKKNKSTVNNKKKRHEILGEITAIYWASKNGGKNFIFPELENKSKFPLDFIFDDLDGKTWNVEVKSPSYEAELAEDLINGSLTIEQLIERKRKPQYQNGEARSIGFSTFKNPIKNSLKKFNLSPLSNNLVILCPNMFSSMAFVGKLEQFYSFRKIVEEVDIKGLISSVCFLEPYLSCGSTSIKFIEEIVNFHGDIPKLNRLD